MGSKDGLQPIEKTVIDRCVHQIYQRYFDNPAPENMPILSELLRMFAADMAPKPDTINTMNEEETQNEI